MFETQKKRGTYKEEKLRQEIANMKEKLSALLESNQQANFKNYERIQEVIDEQERKMIEK